MNLSTYFFLFFLIVAACGTPDYMTEPELQAYVAGHSGTAKTREHHGYRLQMTYKPGDLLVAQELGSSLADSEAQLHRLRTKYNAYDYFVFSLSKAGKEALYAGTSGMGAFSEQVQTLAFRMHDYVRATTSAGDTVALADYAFPRTYGMGSATNLLFVFSREDSRNDAWIQIHVKEFGLGLGHQVFRFRREALEEVPKIKFNVKDE